MMKMLAAVAGLVIAVAVVVTVAADRSLPPDMAGSWSGDAEIFVNWTAQRTLPVRLVIAPDARVTGTIGDATLRSGRLEPNRTAIGRVLHVKTDWIVRGDLDGDVIKPEGIHRERVTLPLDWVDGHFEGAVHTSGSHFGGKQSMWLAAGRLRLSRS
jgi:hypothetical protein